MFDFFRKKHSQKPPEPQSAPEAAPEAAPEPAPKSEAQGAQAPAEAPKKKGFFSFLFSSKAEKAQPAEAPELDAAAPAEAGPELEAEELDRAAAPAEPVLDFSPPEAASEEPLVEDSPAAEVAAEAPFAKPLTEDTESVPSAAEEPSGGAEIPLFPQEPEASAGEAALAAQQAEPVSEDLADAAKAEPSLGESAFEEPQVGQANKRLPASAAPAEPVFDESLADSSQTEPASEDFVAAAAPAESVFDETHPDASLAKTAIIEFAEAAAQAEPVFDDASLDSAKTEPTAEDFAAAATPAELVFDESSLDSAQTEPAAEDFAANATPAEPVFDESLADSTQTEPAAEDLTEAAAPAEPVFDESLADSAQTEQATEDFAASASPAEPVFDESLIDSAKTEQAAEDFAAAAAPAEPVFDDSSLGSAGTEPAFEEPAPPTVLTEPAPEAPPAEAKPAEPLFSPEADAAAEPAASLGERISAENEALFPTAAPAEPEKAKKGWFARLKDRLSSTRDMITGRIEKVLASTRTIDDKALDELEEILFTSDLGVPTTLGLLERIKTKVARKELKDVDALKEALRDALIEMLDAPQKDLVPEDPPRVILVAGVNGVGKTTTIAKLARTFIIRGQKVLLAAGDTFRAAAVEQLKIWAERLGTDFVAQKAGADPAAVVYDALSAAKARHTDVVIIDTAGRLHTKVNLMDELKKIKRVAGKAVPGAPHETILILDANTGQNAFRQAQTFHEAIGVDSIIVTKLDGTSKGGVVVSVCYELKLPVIFIGIGEGYEDLKPFDKMEYASAILGLEPQKTEN